jgi:AcrR family transcriptional regulator
MGRPSLAPLRREQILDAVVHCILRHGLSGTTLNLIAVAAGVQTSLVAHYFGSKEAVVRAAVERTLVRYREQLAAVLAGVPPERQLARLLDAMFTDTLTAPEFGRIIDVLIADSYFDLVTREHLQRLFADFERMIGEAVRASYPRLSPRRRADLAYGLLCLADANTTFSCIGFDPAHHKQARRLADTLVETMTRGRREGA